MSLTFAQLRDANKQRLRHFKNAQGMPAHEKSDGSDWSLLEWLGACLGELGEAANIAKKLRRGDFMLHDREVFSSLSDELADTMIYLDLAAQRAGIDLGEAVVDKFNRTSNKVGSPVRLQPTSKPAVPFPPVAEKLAQYVADIMQNARTATSYEWRSALQAAADDNLTVREALEQCDLPK